MTVVLCFLIAAEEALSLHNITRPINRKPTVDQTYPLAHYTRRLRGFASSHHGVENQWERQDAVLGYGPAST